MKRFLSTAVVLLVSLFAVAVAVPWARSYTGSDYLSRARLVSSDPTAIVTRGHAVTWTRGSIRLTATEHTYYPHGHPVPPAPPDQPAHWGRGRLGRGHLGWDDLPVRSVWNRLGFHAYETGSGASFYDERTRGAAFPAWLPVAIFVALPILAMARKVRGRWRRRNGLCPGCGYDLRASPERCPECGSVSF